MRQRSPIQPREVVIDRFESWSAADGERRVRELFTRAYGGEPQAVALGPGRVNLIGEHVDYSGGMCLPVALPHAAYAAVTPGEGDRVRLVAADTDEPWTGSLDTLTEAPGWAAYVAGVLWALREHDVDLGGVDVAVTGCVPRGGGLSSSAALETAVASALLALTSTRLRPDEVVDACVRAETDVVGAPTGGLDQSAAVYAERGRATLVDFRDHTTSTYPFDPAAAGLALLVIDSRVTHSHADGGYAARRREVEEATRQAEVGDLRELLDRGREVEALPEPLRRRARHVVGEIGRVSRFVGALSVGAWAELGPLLDASHASLRDDFEVSCPEVDLIVDTAKAAGALGARITGGGFGGCAIALVPTHEVESVLDAVEAAVAGAGQEPAAYDVVDPSGPARLLT